MAHTIAHKGFEPARNNADTAVQPRTAGKRWLAISWALRPCGVSVFEAQTRLAERGGQPYTYAYTRSAQYSRSEYAPLGFGLYGRAETVADHVAAVQAAEGAEAAEYVRAALPESIAHDDSAQLLVLYAYAQGGRALGNGGASADDLPASADDAQARRDALTAAPKRSSRKRSSRK